MVERNPPPRASTPAGVAEAAVAVVEGRLLHGTSELCAEGTLNRHDVAALAAEALGRKVEARRVDPASPGGGAGPMRAMFEHYDHTGLLGNPLTPRAVLGREPRILRAYFRELAADHAASRTLSHTAS